jgi:XTP/dITP diphosphohydrolase
MEICFATNNKKKLEEVKAALEGKNIKILSLEDIGCREELAETGNTLDDNAFQKARYVSENYHVNCFADDTGLEVEALGGEPGVYSGRYAGEPRSDSRNIELLLDKLDGEENRKARFRTVIALVLDGKEYKFEGKAEGQITDLQVGSQGFGYDPVFQPEGHEKTFAELDMDEKNAISHRGRAVRRLVAFLTGQEEAF